MESGEDVGREGREGVADLRVEEVLSRRPEARVEPQWGGSCCHCASVGFWPEASCCRSWRAAAEGLQTRGSKGKRGREGDSVWAALRTPIGSIGRWHSMGAWC